MENMFMINNYNNCNNIERYSTQTDTDFIYPNEIKTLNSSQNDYITTTNNNTIPKCYQKEKLLNNRDIYNKTTPNKIEQRNFMKNSNKKNNRKKKSPKSNINKKKIKQDNISPMNKFISKYDYILQPGIKSSGPVEISTDFEYKINSGKIEYDFQKIDEGSKRGRSEDKNFKRNDGIKKINIKIFNNKKNNEICSNLLKQTIENGKELSSIPYAQKKEKIYKTIDSIGFSNGIPYTNVSILSGGNINSGNHNIKYIIRDNKRKKFKHQKMLDNNMFKYLVPNKAEINL